MKNTVARLSSWVSPLGWSESKVTIYFWPWGRLRMATCSCQAAFKNLVSHSTRVWLKCSWIILNIHRRIPEEHGGSTVESLYHIGVRPHCRKLRVEGTHSRSKTFRVVEHARARPPSGNCLTPLWLRTTALMVESNIPKCSVSCSRFHYMFLISTFADLF